MSEIRTARFAAPDEAREKYDAIIPAYQAAFAAASVRASKSK
jgi:hypothetical protein